jgi:RNA polymerase sigma-70 factor (ECF subfamily)
MFSKDNDEVQDLFQDILTNLWTGFDSFRGEAQQKSWVWRVALNTCISVERKKKKRPGAAQLSMDIDLYADDDNDILQVQALHKRINSLGLVDRAIILLWLEDMSYEEIGAIMGITASNVGVKLFRIKERLKQMKDK